ncbi:MAG TPA: type II toxin-antitoxin system HicA family toxin [Candidatus Binatia bacterium]
MLRPCAIRVFTALGWQRARQVGSHVTLVRPGTRPLTIPLHRELAKGTLRALIRARLSPRWTLSPQMR